MQCDMLPSGDRLHRFSYSHFTSRNKTINSKKTSGNDLIASDIRLEDTPQRNNDLAPQSRIRCPNIPYPNLGHQYLSFLRSFASFETVSQQQIRKARCFLPPQRRCVRSTAAIMTCSMFFPKILLLYRSDCATSTG